MGKSKGGKKPNGSAGPSKPAKSQGDDAILDTVSERPYASWVAPSWFNWRVSVFFGLLAIILGFVLIRIEDLRPPSIWSTPNSKSTTAKPSPPKPKAATEKLLSVADIKKRSKGLPCKDRHDSNICAQMAHRGDCDEAIGWMTVMCAAACNRCEFLDPKRRCSEENMGYKFTDALKPGDLDMMFRTISERTSSEIEVVNEKPWMVLVKDFITETESSTLMNLTVAKLKRSTDQGEFSEDGFQHQVVSQHRTSSNSWCISECESNKVVMGLTQRIADLIQVPVENFESFQVLRYELGQKYDVHHDGEVYNSNDHFRIGTNPILLKHRHMISKCPQDREF